MRYERCLVCGSTDVVTVFKRRAVPVNQNIVFDTEFRAREITLRDIELVHCGGCDFVCNAAFDESAVLYDERYDNAQLNSATYTEYISELVGYLLSECGLRDGRIIEVGCGKGEFLRQLVTAEGSNVTGYGFDPSYGGQRVSLEGRMVIEKVFFEASERHLSADALLCRHVIEHIGDPLAFLRSIVAAISDQPKVRFFFETPSINWILEHAAFWDVFYEHCNYWSARSLSTLFESAGIAVDGVRTIWCDQFLWIEGRAQPAEGIDAANALTVDSALREQLFSFAAEESRRRASARREMADFVGRVALWGAAAKGVTMANLVDPDRTLIAALIDINPKKQGKFIPGSGHPIVAPRDLAALGIERIYVMNPNYLSECAAILERIGNPVPLIAV